MNGVLKLKRILLITVCVILTVGFCLATTALITNKSPNNIFSSSPSTKIDPDIPGGNTSSNYDLKTSILYADDSDYKNRTNFDITNTDGWYNFVNSVTSGGCTFRGKTVNLKKDLYFYNAVSYPVGTTIAQGYMGSIEYSSYFAGVFNGNNNTIYGITISDDAALNPETRFIGLFSVLGDDAVVKNLQIDGITFQNACYESKGAMNYIGAIAGKTGGVVQIEQCSVKNVTINYSNYQFYSIYATSFIGTTSAMFSYNENGQLTDVPSSLMIKNCYIENFRYSNSTADYLMPYELTAGTAKVENVVMHYTSTSDSPPNQDDRVIKSTDETSVLGYSSSGGSSGSIWYCGTNEYNNGFPVLRQFLNWQTISIAAGGEGGSPSPTIVYVPSDWSISLNSQGAVRSIKILGQQVNANPEADYNVKEWVWSSSGKSYTIYYDLKKWELEFFNVEEDYLVVQTLKNGISQGLVATYNKTWQVYHNTEINYMFATSGDTFRGAWCEFSFVDVNGDEIVIRYIMKNRTYYIDRCVFAMAIGSEEKTTSSQLQVETDYIVYCSVKQKMYNVEFM